jgi:predicted P-loop ATPase
MLVKGEEQSTIYNFDAVKQAYLDLEIPLVRCKGKRPILLDWTELPHDPDKTPEYYKYNYGVVLQDWMLVIDADPRSYKANENPLKALSRAVGFGFEKTFVVRSGQGGQHIYLRKPPEFNNTMTIQGFTGLAFMSKGHCVIGPGSISPETGDTYEILNGSPHDILDAPDELLELLTKRCPTVAGIAGFRDDEQTQLRFLHYIADHKGAVQGENGDDYTYYTACKGRDFGLSKEVTFALMAENFNPKCIPRWSAHELSLKVENAYNYAKGEVGSEHPEAVFAQISADQTKGEELEKLTWDWIPNKIDEKTGLNIPKANWVPNIINFFRIADVGSYTNPLRKMVGYSLFSKQYEFRRPAPWHYATHPCRTWSDNDTNQLAHHLYNRNNYYADLPKCATAMETYAAAYNAFHPVHDYLNGLKWDGKPRVDELFVKYCGAKDTVYHRAVAKCMMIAAVARVMQPGCKFDQIVVLEGAQGIGKSTFIQKLAVKKEWYVDVQIETQGKSTIEIMRGKLIGEVSELEFNRRSDVNAIKAFLSKMEDRHRMAYQTYAEDFPRQFILIGTLNPEGDGGYLKDTTGNRRWWPVECGNHIDTDGLEIELDQIWAEAYERFKTGETFYLNTKELKTAAVKEQEKREITDSFQMGIEEFLHKMTKAQLAPVLLTTYQIAYEMLEIPAKFITRDVQVRISNVMQKLGWDKGKFYDKESGRTINGFRNRIHTPSVLDDL